MVVYEPTTDFCESVVTTRTAKFGMSDDRDQPWPIMFDHEYSLEVVETTPLSCCLAAEDFPKNVNACVEDLTTTSEYIFDKVSETCELVSYN